MTEALRDYRSEHHGRWVALPSGRASDIRVAVACGCDMDHTNGLIVIGYMTSILGTHAPEPMSFLRFWRDRFCQVSVMSIWYCFKVSLEASSMSF